MTQSPSNTGQPNRGQPNTGQSSGARPCPTCGTAMPANSKHQTCPKCLLGLALGGQRADGRANVTTSPHVRPEAQSGDGWSVAELEARFPQLEFLGLIGKGGMGTVYKVRQKALDRIAALKVLPARASGDASFEERFVREARTLAKLGHPNIVTVFEFGEQDGLYFFLMEYVDGVNLRSLMSDGSLSGSEALSIVGQICDALQYAHEMAIVHRDIKPENVLIDQRGSVKIADFGLAKILEKPALDMTLTGAHQVVGTLNYMAPEQRERPADVDHRADIYSLGVVFYELLTGELPLGRFAPPSKRSGVHSELDDVVMRSLEKDPEERYQHADDLKTDCDRASSLEHATQPQRTPEPAAHGAADAGEAQRARRASILTVPCSLPTTLEGIYDYVGILRLEGEQLTLQYRGQEAFFGSSPMGTKEVVLNLDQIDSIQFTRGVRWHKVYVTPLDLNCVTGLPGFERGRIQILIARADREAAETIIRQCGNISSVRCLVPDPPSERETRQAIRMPAIGLAAYAILSILSLLGLGGSFAVRNTFIGIGAFEYAWLGAGSFVFVAFQCFILWGALEMYHGRHRKLAQAASIASLVPLSPWSVLGIGMGVWSLIALRRDDVVEYFARVGNAGIDEEARERRPGKPSGDAEIRLEAASRLRFSTAALRLCGCASMLLLATGVALMLTNISVGLWPTGLAWRQQLGLAIIAGAFPGCFLMRTQTNLPRRRLLGLSILGLLPISLVWPLSVCFSVWTLSVLHDPDVMELQSRAALPHTTTPRAMRAFFLALIVATVPAFVIQTVWQRSNKTVRDRYVVVDQLVRKSPDEVQAEVDWKAASRVLQSRLDDLNLKGQVGLQDPAYRRVAWSMFMSEAEIQRAVRICRIRGQIELAILADEDLSDAGDSTDGETTDLEYAAGDPDYTVAGLRIAILSSTRWTMSEPAIDDVDTPDKSSGRNQTVRFELTDEGRGSLLEKWRGALEDRAKEAKQTLRVGLIIDGKVCGTGQIEGAKNFDFERPITLSGSYPMRTEEEWISILKSGPTPDEFTISEPPLTESSRDEPTRK